MNTDPLAQDAAAPASNALRVLVVEDHPLVRLGLATMIGADPRLEVCGEADSEEEAWRLIERLDPDVVLVDLVLRSGTGMDLIRRVASRRPSLRVVVSSMLDRGVYESRAMRAGASAFVSKNASIDLLLAEIGGAGPTRSDASNRAQRVATTVGDAVGSLSDREVDVYRMIGQGLTTREIAQRLYRSVKTVESYKARIKQKLAFRNAAELTRNAVLWASPSDAPPDALAG